MTVIRSLTLFFVAGLAIGLTACGAGGIEGALDGQGLPENTAPSIVVVNDSSNFSSLSKVWVYDANAGTEPIPYDIVPPLPPNGFTGVPIPSPNATIYELTADFTSGARSWSAGTTFTDGTGRGTQFRDRPTVYPGESATVVFIER